MKTPFLMMAAALAAAAAPAFADGGKGKAPRQRAVSVTAVEMTSPAAGGPGRTHDSTANVERTPEGMNDRSDNAKASGNKHDPNSGDPARPPR